MPFTPRNWVDGLGVWNEWQPEEQGLLAASGSLDVASTSGQPGSQQPTFTKIRLRKPVGTVSRLVMVLTTLGSSLVAGESRVALFAPDGTRIGLSADASADWAAGSTNRFVNPVLTPEGLGLDTEQFVDAGYLIGAMMSNGTTRPAFARRVGASHWNLGLSELTYRASNWPANDRTTMPSTLSGSGLTATVNQLWMAVE